MKIYNIKNGIKIANENESVEVTIQNEKWITVHPNGEDEKGRHLLLEDGILIATVDYHIDLPSQESTDNPNPSNPEHIAKRIYTVEEATATVSGKGKNTFTIRYR